MFKKALLSSLVSVFLTLSILTVATAFGAPTENPPSGLTSPTFGGLRVNGTSYIQTIQNGEAGTDPWPLVINDDLQVLQKIQNSTGKTTIELTDSLFKASNYSGYFQFDYTNGLYSNRDLKTGGVVEATELKSSSLNIANGTNVIAKTDAVSNLFLNKVFMGTNTHFQRNNLYGVSTIKGGILASNTGLRFADRDDDLAYINVNSPLIGNSLSKVLELGQAGDTISMKAPVTANSTMTVTGKLTAGSISSGAFNSTGKITATSIGTWASPSSSISRASAGVATISVLCGDTLSNSIVVSCGFDTNKDDVRMKQSAFLPLFGSCSATAYFPAATAANPATLTVYARCFTPAS